MQKLNLLVSSSLVAMAVLFPQQTRGMEDAFPEKATASLSGSRPSTLLSSLQNVASNTVSWMHESALSGCDRFGKWIASYAKDLPPAYFAKTFLEIDYAHDELFWQGHFYQELKDIKQARFPKAQDQERLKELQGIVWNGLLSPYAYEEGLKELEKKRSFFSSVQNTRDAFQSGLKENQGIVLQHLRKDLLGSLEEIQNDGEESGLLFLMDFTKKLSYYRNALNAFDYAETLAALCTGMEENKAKLALSETQYKGFMESLTDALHKINKAQYFQIKAGREANPSLQNTAGALQDQNSVSKTEDTGTRACDVFSRFSEKDNIKNTTASSFFSYPLSFVKGASDLVKQGISFTLEYPMQAITMGLAFQAAAVAAKSSFALPQRLERSKGIYGNRHNQIQRMRSNSNIIDLARLLPAQGFMIEGAMQFDNLGSSVSSAGDFNGDGVSDIIVGAWEAHPQGRKEAGSSYVIYGKKGGYPAPIDLASLNATQGVIIEGAAEGDWSGRSVNSAGDFNGDGLGDVIVGAPFASSQGRQDAGSSYIIYGRKGGYHTSIDLSNLSPNQGVIIEGAATYDQSGCSVSSAGDFNGDGVSDVMVGANNARPQGRLSAGSSYVIYGKKGGYPAPLDLASLATTQGVVIEGAIAGDFSGSSVSSAGDFNGDGLSDVIVGAYASPQGRLSAGSSYVIYGKKGGYFYPIDLASLNANQSVTIEGAAKGDASGWSVSSAGDFNGDGVGDVIIGAYLADPKGCYSAGTSYVVYGKKGGYLAPLDLAYLNASQGVIIEGAAACDYFGWSVSSAGDFNGDGLSDVIVGAYNASHQGRQNAGSSYVIYGRKGGYQTPLGLAYLNATQGVIIEGAVAGYESGFSVSSAGDFNGDGLSDVIVGADIATPKGRRWAGTGYVIYGKNITGNNVQKHGQ